MPDAVTFAFVAADPDGRRVQGQLEASTASLAHAELRARGLSPIRLRAASQGLPGAVSQRRMPGGAPGARALAEFLSNLSALLAAGADIRAALDMLSTRSDGGSAKSLAAALARDLSGGSSLSAAMASRLPARMAFISSLAEAGASGVGLAGGLQRAAQMLEARVRLSDQMVTTLSYPAFVLLTTMGAIAAILFFVAPSLAPLVEEGGGSSPWFLRTMVGLSAVLSRDAPLIAGGLAVMLVLGGLWLRTPHGRTTMQRLLLDGPAKRTVGSLAYGSFAITLGSLLTGGASMDAALTLATAAVGDGVLRRRLYEVGVQVRQGRKLSEALGARPGVPSSIIRLAMVGEATGSLGEMLARSGRLEEAQALRRLESLARAIGPVAIVLLGSVIGLLMAGLLSGVSQLGQAAVK